MPNAKHGLSGTGVYNSWSKMMQRCYTKHNKNYAGYGGNGITVCKEWHDVLVFHAWAMANGWANGLEIDRFPNNKGNYEPSNCRWVTSKVNNNNRQDNFLITAFGKTLSASQWSELYPVNRKTLVYRIQKLKVSAEDALIKEPNFFKIGIPNNNKRYITAFGKTQCISVWAKETGNSILTIQKKLDKWGWTVEDALTKRLRAKKQAA